MSQPASINTGCVQGETYSLSLIWKDKDTGTPIDVTDYTGAMQVRTCPDDSPVLSWSSVQGDIVFGGASGSIIVTGAASDTVSVTPDVYSYDLKLTSPGGVVRVIVSGKFTVIPRVTQ